MERMFYEIIFLLVCTTGAMAHMAVTDNKIAPLLLLLQLVLVSSVVVIIAVSGKGEPHQLRAVVFIDSWLTGLAGLVVCGGSQSSSFMLLATVSPMLATTADHIDLKIVVLSIIGSVFTITTTVFVELEILDTEPLPVTADLILSQSVVFVLLVHFLMVKESPRVQAHIDTIIRSPNPLDVRRRSRVTDCAFSNIDDLSSARVVQRTVHWKRGDLIGQGAFGQVHIGLNLETGELMAVKRVPFNRKSSLSCKRMKTLENELRVMEPLNHVNIVRHFFTEMTPSSMNIFMEYVPGGSLSKLIYTFGPLSESTVVQYLYQLLNGLAHLHSKGIIHRDIKCANLLLTVEGRVKLADFGASVILQEKQEALRDVQGTPNWMAPEVLSERGHGWAADIWSVGCTVMEMLTGRAPWYHLGITQVAIMKYIAGTKPIDISVLQVSTASTNFMMRCLKRDPLTRPSALSLLQDHYFVHEDSRLADSASSNKMSSSFCSWSASIATGTKSEEAAVVHAGWKTTVLTADKKLRSSLLQSSQNTVAPAAQPGYPNLSEFGIVLDDRSGSNMQSSLAARNASSANPSKNDEGKSSYSQSE